MATGNGIVESAAQADFAGDFRLGHPAIGAGLPSRARRRIHVPFTGPMRIEMTDLFPADPNGRGRRISCQDKKVPFRPTETLCAAHVALARFLRSSRNAGDELAPTSRLHGTQQ